MGTRGHTSTWLDKNGNIASGGYLGFSFDDVLTSTDDKYYHGDDEDKIDGGDVV